MLLFVVLSHSSQLIGLTDVNERMPIKGAHALLERSCVFYLCVSAESCACLPTYTHTHVHMYSAYKLQLNTSLPMNTHTHSAQARCALAFTLNFNRWCACFLNSSPAAAVDDDDDEDQACLHQPQLHRFTCVSCCSDMQTRKNAFPGDDTHTHTHSMLIATHLRQINKQQKTEKKNRIRWIGAKTTQRTHATPAATFMSDLHTLSAQLDVTNTSG